jgi:hypothetical protein
MVLGTSSLLAAPAAGTGGGTGTAISGRAVGSLGFTPTNAPFGKVGNFGSMASGFGTAITTHPFKPFYQSFFGAPPSNFGSMASNFQSMAPTLGATTPTFNRSLTNLSPINPNFSQSQNVPFAQLYQNTFGQINHPFAQFYQNSFGVQLPTFESTTTPAVANNTTTTPNFGATSPNFQALYNLTP